MVAGIDGDDDAIIDDEWRGKDCWLCYAMRKRRSKQSRSLCAKSRDFDGPIAPLKEGCEIVYLCVSIVRRCITLDKKVVWRRCDVSGGTWERSN